MLDCTRINRNIVECKARPVFPTPCPDLSINRNIVECKVYSKKILTSVILVLIETLWNVKEILCYLQDINFESINRNIVECKGSDSWQGSPVSWY